MKGLYFYVHFYHPQNPHPLIQTINKMYDCLQ